MTDALLPHVLSQLGLALFERTDTGTFRPFSDPPPWVEYLSAWNKGEVGELVPGEGLGFLENFLIDAERFWRESDSGFLRSGIWCVTGPDQRELSLDAYALASVDGRTLLAVELLDDSYEERRTLLQRARETSLSYEALRREVDKKEVLLHCIVHDLRGPLTGVVGALSLLKARSLSEEKRKTLLDMSLRQARNQDAMIKSVLEVFSSEVDALESFEIDPAKMPDVRKIAREAVERLRPAYQAKGVALEAVGADAKKHGSLPVVGRADRLERVFANLLENALRFSELGQRVRVRLEDGADEVTVSIEDQGPGVPEEVAETLFDRFASGKDKPGVAGLGLYFCRITVAQWGGAIGYAPRKGGGSRFWFRLRKSGIPDAAEE